MRVETKKTLILTKEEQELIKKLYTILNEDDEVSVSDVWNILIGISEKDDTLISGYELTIID